MQAFLHQVLSGLANGGIYASIALELADHAYLLETGTIIMGGPSSVISSDESVRRAYLGY